MSIWEQMRQGPKPGEWMLHPDVVCWPGSGGPLRYSGDSTMSPLVLWGLDAMLQMWPRLHLYVFSPIALLREFWRECDATTSGRVWFSDLFSPRQLSMGDSRQEGSHLTGRCLSPPTGVMEAVGVTSEGTQLIASVLSTEVVETILQTRAPSTRKLYTQKWRLFTS